MKLAFALFPCLAVLTAASALHPATVPQSATTTPLTPETSILPKGRAAALVKALSKAKGCKANLCFAIDGSHEISPDEFRLQKEFVLDLISIVSVENPTRQAAVQYGLGNSFIISLTGNVGDFNNAVEDVEQVGGPSSRGTGGLNYCISQVLRRPGEAIKVVLLGDGIQKLGSRLERRANWFRRIGGDISVVAAGEANFGALRRIVGGNEKRIFKVDDFFDIVTLQNVIAELALDVCGNNPALN